MKKSKCLPISSAQITTTLLHVNVFYKNSYLPRHKGNRLQGTALLSIFVISRVLIHVFNLSVVLPYFGWYI